MEAIHQDKKGLEARVGIEPALLMENTEVIDNTMSKSRKKAIKAHYVSRFSHSIMRVFAFPDLQKRPCDPGLSHGTLFGQTCLKGCRSCRCLWCRLAHLAR
jgi:hypothetical protein